MDKKMPNLFHRMLRYAIKALDSEKRQLIVSYIIQHGPATPGELEKALGIRGEKLDYHLRQLVIGNIVECRIIKEKETYRLTPFGIDLLNGIFKSLIPKELQS